MEKIKTEVKKEDITVPELGSGESAIVFLRHEEYDRDKNSNTAGSILEQPAEAATKRYQGYFKELFGKDKPGDAETVLFFVSSDTQYAGKGHRSLETAQLAQDSAVQVLSQLGIEPSGRIINLDPEHNVRRFDPTDQDVRTHKGITEPAIFDSPGYVKFLQDKYGSADGEGNGLSQKAWAVHEEDGEKEIRESFGAEGVIDIIDRTKHTLNALQRYSEAYHHKHPNKKLVIWLTSHYDTISPLMKSAQGLDLGEYLPVDYGAGVVIELKLNKEAEITTKNGRIGLKLGSDAVSSALKT